MHKIGVIGDYDSICGFAALGLDVFFVDSVAEASKVLKRLAGNNYGIIYITEYYAKELQEEFERYQTSLLPALIPIPSNMGSEGFGVANLKRAVEQAVGSDIIFNVDN